MRPRPLMIALAPALAAGLALSACDESEQGRILRYEKGVYLGKPDQPLSEEQQAELRARTHLQQGP